MKYRYNKDLDVFVRVDNRGRKLDITNDEADKICQLVMKGYTNQFIYDKLELDIKPHTLKTFILQFKNGNIIGYNPVDYKLGIIDKIKMRLHL